MCPLYTLDITFGTQKPTDILPNFRKFRSQVSTKRDTDMLSLLVQSAKRIVTCYILFPGLPFHFSLKPSSICYKISSFMKKYFLAMGMSTLCIKQIRIKFTVITLSYGNEPNSRIVNRIQSAMTIGMMWPDWGPAFQEQAPIKLQALLATVRSLRMVDPFNPAYIAYRLSYDYCSCTLLIVHSFLLFCK